jgi:hypothetical protein
MGNWRGRRAEGDGRRRGSAPSKEGASGCRKRGGRRVRMAADGAQREMAGSQRDDRTVRLGIVDAYDRHTISSRD